MTGLWRRRKPNPNPTPDKPVPSPNNPTKVPRQLLKAHNEERSGFDIRGLYLSRSLCQVAQAHAQWMLDNKTMSHTGENKSTVGTRVRNAGYTAVAVGENIAHGYSTIESVMKGWMNSSGHRSNILRPQYIECGLAQVDDYWCVVFTAPPLIGDNSTTKPQLLCPTPLESPD